MNVILYDNKFKWLNLLPLTFTRPISEIRIGILKISEKWKYLLSEKISYFCAEHLQKKYPLYLSDDNVIINSILLPDENIVQKIKELEKNEAIVDNNNEILVARLDYEKTNAFFYEKNNNIKISYTLVNPLIIKNYCDIFKLNGIEIIKDFDIITNRRISEKISHTNTIIGDKNSVFIEKGAIVEGSIININNGPVYIGQNVEIMEGCLIRGPVAICEGAVLKMGAKIYGPTTIGPFSKAGGEINNSVILGYSNKAHEGFLGNSVIGEWCNIGADSNNSNLKNTYDNVKMWNYAEKKFVDTGLQFAGLIMGDHTKCGINTMFNTGTVVGVSCNLFGSGYHRQFIPSFTWGGPNGYSRFNFDKAIEVAKNMMQRRNVTLNEIDLEILKWIFENDT
ncbi:MAG: GlmU family protein [Bacteroidales bacterium]|nr:GlmU family protein [Bacteroidales bacterium]